MKRSTVAILTGLALLLPGCVVTSLHPFYGQDDLLFEPALVGTWISNDTTDGSKGQAQFTRHEDQAYILASANNNEPSETWVAHLFKLGDQHFLDLFPQQGTPGPGFVPVHRVMKITISTNTIELAELKYEWLGKLLESDPAAVPHEVIVEGKDQEGKENRRIVLTAATKELQDLLRRHAANADAWNEPAQLKRAPSGQ